MEMSSQMGCHVYDTTKQHGLQDEDIQGIHQEADGIRVKNTYRSNAFYCLETMECVHGVNKGARKNHIYMSNFYF